MKKLMKVWSLIAVLLVVGRGLATTDTTSESDIKNQQAINNASLFYVKSSGDSVVRTDIPGVDRYCPVSGDECVELKPGDLIFREMHNLKIGNISIPFRWPFWHVGIYKGDGYVIEALLSHRKTVITPISQFDSLSAPWKGATTVIGFKGLSPSEENRLRKEVIDTANSYLDTPYSRNFFEFLDKNPSGETLQCAQLAYLSYKSIGYDIRRKSFPKWPGIAPVDVYKRTAGEIPGSGVLGNDSYSGMVDPST